MMVNIPRLIELYGPDGVFENYVEQAHRRFAFSICALSTYKLVPADEKVSPSLVSIASQMGARNNTIPIVLAETIMGLDLFKSGQTNTFSDSPHLLQIWLPNKVGLLEAPLIGWNHFPRRMLKRSMLYPEREMLEWYVFLHDMQSDDIIWRCPWLNMHEMAVISASFERMVIAGLASFTFYIPGRTLRQLGMSQGLHKTGIENFQLSNFDIQTLHNYWSS
ncbi:hypothetical protein RHMOL_Rhmol05G0162600 [Rhododendron molle]|uniref:Uncharacterized protein n=1 Tax=Rhododendron molle TaxID=49168 RepID=A0ACC0NS19_RHOML|nr:hypothetical protein RHMOL_Rhmol05G0162600 [Rhododendron molle]